MERILVGVSGASGTILAYLAVKSLLRLGWEVDLVLTESAKATASYELGKELRTGAQWKEKLGSDKLNIWGNKDFFAPFASGSFPYYGMLLIPCSMATLAAAASGLSDNLVRRGVDVMIKERRPLVVVPREAPFSSIHLENMLKLAHAGATIVPPIPAYYTLPKSVEESNMTIIGRCLDALKIPHSLYERWEGISS